MERTYIQAERGLKHEAHHVPLILRREIYATAAIAGILVYLGIKALGMDNTMAILHR